MFDSYYTLFIFKYIKISLQNIFWKQNEFNSPDRADILAEIKARAGGKYFWKSVLSASKAMKNCD